MIRLICYDLEDNKLRTKLAKLLDARGMERIQYSVFAGKLDERRWKNCWHSVEHLLKDKMQPGDKTYYLEISEQAFCKMTCLGQQLDTAYIAGKINALLI